HVKKPLPININSSVLLPISLEANTILDSSPTHFQCVRSVIHHVLGFFFHSFMIDDLAKLILAFWIALCGSFPSENESKGVVTSWSPCNKKELVWENSQNLGKKCGKQIAKAKYLLATFLAFGTPSFKSDSVVPTCSNIEKERDPIKNVWVGFIWKIKGKRTELEQGFFFAKTFLGFWGNSIKEPQHKHVFRVGQHLLAYGSTSHENYKDSVIGQKYLKNDQGFLIGNA
ncbi:hypothetical protein ACJX0J_022542, partial [Zea mays]